MAAADVSLPLERSLSKLMASKGEADVDLYADYKLKQREHEFLKIQVGGCAARSRARARPAPRPRFSPAELVGKSSFERAHRITGRGSWPSDSWHAPPMSGQAPRPFLAAPFSTASDPVPPPLADRVHQG